MSAPKNKQKEGKQFRIITACIGVFVFYFFLHVPKAWDGTTESINYIVNHMIFKPFDIFPLDSQFVGIGLMLSLVIMLLMYQYFLGKRNLRPEKEYGSAGWNENLKAYYRNYADAALRFILPISKPKGKGVLSKMFRDFLTFLEDLIFGWSFQVNEDTGGKEPWTFQETKDGHRIFEHHGTRNMIMTDDVVLDMNGRKTKRNDNTLVAGGSGTGKSRFMIKPNMLQANSSFVITDPSGELLESMGNFLKQIGYDIRVFNLVQMDHSNCYNPFAYIRNEEGVLTMINALIMNTTPKGASKGDPFWEKAETALLQAICFYLQAECNLEDQNFNSVMKLLRCCEAGEGQEDQDSVLDVLMNELKENHPEHIAIQSYAIFKSAGGGKTAQSILISCQTRLQVFNLEVIKNLTNTDDINLRTIGDKPTALFCITPVVDPTFNFLVALLYTQLFDVLYYHAETECNPIYHQGLRLPLHVRFLLDEFANIGSIPDFSQKLATMRKYEISCTIVIQALSQLKTMYKDDWEVLVGNCDSFLFLGGSDATTLEYISKKLGKETIRAKNTSRSYGKSGSSSTSMNTLGRELMQPDELSNMDNENCIYFLRGEKPFFSKKYKYERHPNYKFTADADDSLSFDVKKTINTAEASPTTMNVSDTKRKVIRKKAEQTSASATQISQEQKTYYRAQKVETQARNIAIQKEERARLEQVNLNASSIEEVIDQNHLSITPEELTEHISARYAPDGISEVSNEFMVEDGMGSEIEEEIEGNDSFPDEILESTSTVLTEDFPDMEQQRANFEQSEEEDFSNVYGMDYSTEFMDLETDFGLSEEG